MSTIVFVTQNPNKLEDVRRLMQDFEIDHVDFAVPEIQSLSSKDIIEHKLKFAYSRVKRPCFVIDTSLYIDALNGFPGPLVKWFWTLAGSEKICQIVSLLGNANCHWTSLLGYFDGEKEYFFEETVEGVIPDHSRGSGGYAWDDIVMPKGVNKTFAEMTFDEKQSFAVTKKLLKRFADFLITESRNLG